MRRVLLGAILLYLLADYCDPGLPGVFCFDTATLFVEATMEESAPDVPVPSAVHVAGLVEETGRTVLIAASAATRIDPPPVHQLAQSRGLPVKKPSDEG